jgi:hypothetical protein
VYNTPGTQGSRVASSRLLATDWFPFDHFSSHLAIFVVFAFCQLFSMLSFISRVYSRTGVCSYSVSFLLLKCNK